MASLLDNVARKVTDDDLQDGQSLIEYPELNLQLICSLNTDREQLLENVRTNVKRTGLSRVWPCKPQPEGVRLAIVAGGPSLADTVNELRALIAEGVNVIALANSTAWLLDHGIQPSAQVVLDAKPNNATFVHDVPGCTYFVASQCDPSVFERVLSFEGVDGHTGPTKNGNSQRVFMWHAINNEDEFDAVLGGTDEPWTPIHAGSTITYRAIRLFQVLGYSAFHMFGFDSCVMNERHHAYDQKSADHFLRAEITCNGRPFVVTGWMVHQAMEFTKFCKEFAQELDLYIHGDGLIAHMVRSVNENRSKRAA